ncbi:MAG: hypothetical protein O7D91_20230 [Planctomycetota bacterium]|nr:hypothetical protein [Planctomycetota bacterium]
MNCHNTVVDLPTVPIPLPTNSHRMLAALGRARLVHATDSLGVRMVLSHDLLASISQLFLIPLDRFEKAL